MHTLTRCCLLLVAIAAAGAVHAADTSPPAAFPVSSVERGIEADSSTVLMPASETGTITVNQCVGCRAERLSVTPETRYYAGTQQLTLRELKSLLTPGHTTLMTVFADPKEPIALRIVALTAPPPARR